VAGRTTPIYAGERCKAGCHQLLRVFDPHLRRRLGGESG
jgi:hypothetical protein